MHLWRSACVRIDFLICSLSVAPPIAHDFPVKPIQGHGGGVMEPHVMKLSITGTLAYPPDVLGIGHQQRSDFQGCPWHIFICPNPSHSNLCLSHPMRFPLCYYNINMEYNSIKIIKFMKV